MRKFYKNAATQPRPPLSFVAAVKTHGDHWKLGIPAHVNVYRDFHSVDGNDFAMMVLCERGVLPRVSA